VIVGPDGALYFTDPTLDLAAGEKQEIPFQGVYRLDAKGNVQLLTKDLTQPNGSRFRRMASTSTSTTAKGETSAYTTLLLTVPSGTAVSSVRSQAGKTTAYPTESKWIGTATCLSLGQKASGCGTPKANISAQ
jgi:hypothetical protein